MCPRKFSSPVSRHTNRSIDRWIWGRKRVSEWDIRGTRKSRGACDSVVCDPASRVSFMFLCEYNEHSISSWPRIISSVRCAHLTPRRRVNISVHEALLVRLDRRLNRLFFAWTKHREISGEFFDRTVRQQRRVSDCWLDNGQSSEGIWGNSFS